jgi:pimeloyl-ACP methyl ester carboxylesterase
VPGSTTATTRVDHLGCRLHAAVRGDGPPVLLIQGCAAHGDTWKPQTEALAERHQCLSFDNRGIGLSQPVGVAITVEQMADDAWTLMQALGWDSAHVVGHSLGGLVALHLALQDRRRVRSLALLCTFARGRDAAPSTPRMMWAGLRSQIGSRRSRRRAFLELVVPPGEVKGADRDALAERLGHAFGHDLGAPPAVVPRQLAAMRAYDAAARLGELGDVPTLVVSAEHDPIAPPAAGRALASGIPGARFETIAGASHAVPLQRPSEINAMLLGHLDRAERARGAAADAVPPHALAASAAIVSG